MYGGATEWSIAPPGRRALQPDPGIAELSAAVERFRTAARVPREPAALGADLVQLHHLRDLLDLEIAERTRIFEESDQATVEGSSDAFQWIRHNCRTTTTAALNAIHVGREMASLPASVGAVEAGQIGFGHLAIIATTKRALDESPSASPVDEETLVDLARDSSVGRFWYNCLHVRHAADPDGMLDDHVRAVGARSLKLTKAPDGALCLKGFLDAVGGATLRTALEPLARPEATGDDRSRCRRLADALVEMSQHALDSGTLPVRNGVRPHVQVTAPLSTLTAAEGAPAAEIEFAGPVPAATAHRFSCDGAVRRILFDAKSAVVDVGRAARVPAPATRHALIARDKGCAWPGCERSAGWTSAHHLRHWARAGPTNLENLALLCYRHHWMAHEGGWELVRDPDGGITAIPPVPRRQPHDPSRAPDLPAARA